MDKKEINEFLVQEYDFIFNYQKYIEEAAIFLKEKISKTKKDFTPLFGITLGSGLSSVAETIEDPTVIKYEEIPNFPKNTIQGHGGEMVLGYIKNVPVICLKGRAHYYEWAHLPSAGRKVVFYIHLLKELGINNLFLLNSSGGLNKSFKVGDMMMIKDFYSLIQSPLLGLHHDFGNNERFQPIADYYDPEFEKILLNLPEEIKPFVHQGNFLGHQGPNYETNLECKIYREVFQCDAVAMSTIPEIIVAKNRNFKIIAASIISNVIDPSKTNASNHEEVVRILNSPEVKDRTNLIIKNFFQQIHQK